MLASCNDDGCPLNNSVLAQYNFYTESNGTLTKINILDTINVYLVRDAKDDTLIYNRAVNVSSITLPMSYDHATDTVVFRYRLVDGGTKTPDSIFVTKTDIIHYESLDCPIHTFHNITSVSVSNSESFQTTIVNANIDYETKENIRIIIPSNSH